MKYNALISIDRKCKKYPKSGLKDILICIILIILMCILPVTIMILTPALSETQFKIFVISPLLLACMIPFGIPIKNSIRFKKCMLDIIEDGTIIIKTKDNKVISFNLLQLNSTKYRIINYTYSNTASLQAKKITALINNYKDDIGIDILYTSKETKDTFIGMLTLLGFDIEKVHDEPADD